MRFEYLEPKTVAEAVSLLANYDGKAKIIAGGTDLMVQMRDGRISPEFVVDIGGIEGLDYIRYDERQGLTVGALTPIRSLEKSTVLQQRIPILSQAAGQLGSVAIRNVGTIGGNLCNAAPSAETAPSLIALGGNARIVGPGGERKVPLEGFFTGPGKTALSVGELLVEIQVPPPAPNTRGLYLKHGVRGTIDLAVVGVAVVIAFEADGLTCRDARIALGAVAPTPIRARSAEDLLKGKKLDDGLIHRSAKAAVGETSCISDVRASAEYRREMVEVFTRRALTGLVDR
jgi:aerobic carbon-monoxide dehydrogenase medium subunit